MKKIKWYVLSGLIISAIVVLFANNTLLNTDCSNTSTKINLINITPIMLNYAKDSFNVERIWIAMNNLDSKINLSAFIYLPVLSSTNQIQDVLPNKQWQTKHLEIIRKKIGDSVAIKLITSQISLASNGKTPDKKMPFIVFGPGLGWLPTDYSYLLASLASKGYIVVAVTGLPISNHIYFPDNTFESIDKVNVDYTKTADYLSFTVNQILIQSEDKNSRLFELIDTSKVIVVGHSISGAASLIAASKNQSIKAVVNLDGDVNDEFENIQPVQPILYITTQPPGADNPIVETWNEEKNEKRRDNAFLNNTTRCKNCIRIKIPEMYHRDFLDASKFKANISAACNRKNFGKISFTSSSEIIIQSISNFIEGNTSWNNFGKKYNIYIQQK